MFVIGAEVTTQYGHGRVSDVRQDGGNQKIVVLLDAWKLTGKSFVTCYLQPHSVALYVPKTLHEMNLNEKVEYAKKMRAEGKHHYACRDHGKSLVANTKAVDAVRSVLRGYSRSEVGAANRANLLVLKVDALNDAAACSVALEIYEGAEMFARRALQLIGTSYFSPRRRWVGMALFVGAQNADAIHSIWKRLSDTMSLSSLLQIPWTI